MGVERESSQISMLRLEVEKKFGRKPSMHNDFLELAENIKDVSRKFISETTLERVWGYSHRGYQGVSVHTLDLLCEYAGAGSWREFCRKLKDSGFKDSDMFEGDAIYSDDLEPGDRIELKWLPDRVATVRYLGNHSYVAEHCVNSTLREGDTFSCIEFRLNQPVIMDHFIASNDISKQPRRYVAGLHHGISHLRKI